MTERGALRLSLCALARAESAFWAHRDKRRAVDTDPDRRSPGSVAQSRVKELCMRRSLGSVRTAEGEVSPPGAGGRPIDARSGVASHLARSVSIPRSGLAPPEAERRRNAATAGLHEDLLLAQLAKRREGQALDPGAGSAAPCPAGARTVQRRKSPPEPGEHPCMPPGLLLGVPIGKAPASTTPILARPEVAAPLADGFHRRVPHRRVPSQPPLRFDRVAPRSARPPAAGQTR